MARGKVVRAEIMALRGVEVGSIRAMFARCLVEAIAAAWLSCGAVTVDVTVEEVDMEP